MRPHFLQWTGLTRAHWLAGGRVGGDRGTARGYSEQPPREIPTPRVSGVRVPEGLEGESCPLNEHLGRAGAVQAWGSARRLDGEGRRVD